MKKILLLVSGLLFLVSCGKMPTADFSVDKEIVSTGEPVQFTNKSINAYYYHWKFGDRTESREKDPVHAYERPGEYTVLLHVTNKGGDNWENAYAQITVMAYNRYFVGRWSVLETDTTEKCGIISKAYNFYINQGNQQSHSRVIIENLFNMFPSLTGYCREGAPNKLEINESNVMTNNGERYDVNGTLILNNNIMNINCNILPRDTNTVCGFRHIVGTGQKH